MTSFKGSHFPKDIILYAVFFYVRYGVSYRVLEEIMAERGVKVDHATLNRWGIDYSPLIVAEAKKRKRPVTSSWRIDETYVKVKGQWVYLLAPLINSAPRLISWFPSTAMKQRPHQCCPLCFSCHDLLLLWNAVSWQPWLFYKCFYETMY